MIRPLLAACLALLPLVSSAKAAKPFGFRLDAEITSADIPGGVGEASTFGERVELDGDWLAVSERSPAEWSYFLKIHLFKREAAGWTWKQALDLDVPWTVGLDRLPAFDLEDGRLVVADPFPGGVTLYAPGDSGVWEAVESFSSVEGETCLGSPFMRLEDDLLFLPEPVDGGRILILSKSSPASGWSVEAIVPWSTLQNSNILLDYPSYDTDGSRLILRTLVRNAQQNLVSQVEILNRASGWNRETLLVQPSKSSFIPREITRGPVVAIDGDQAWVLNPDQDAFGNSRGPARLNAFQRVGKRWAPAGNAKTTSTFENSVATGHGLIATYGNGDTGLLLPFTPNSNLAPATFYRPGAWKTGITDQPITGVSLGGSGRFATTVCLPISEDDGSEGIVRVYQDPFGLLYMRK